MIGRFAATGVCVVLALVTRGERVRACSGGGDWDGYWGSTTFDSNIVDEWPGLAWDPNQATFGGPCGECLEKAVLDDWTAHLAGVTAADWKKVLLQATDAELVALRKAAAGTTATKPKGYDRSTLWKVTAKDRVLAALDFVRLARKVEGFTTLGEPWGQPAPLPPVALANEVRAGMANKDPFLAQRYAFQGLRVAFYRRDWTAAATFYEANQAVLAKPSTDLAWNARHYYAGATMRRGLRGRANLEFARISAGYRPLTGWATFEFSPQNDDDWKDALKLATSVKDKIELWRLVGIRKDGLVATREILKLDPRSSQVPLLIVRELSKIEERLVDRHPQWPPDPKDIVAQTKAFGVIETLALEQIKNGGDRPWLMELIAGHISAIRGDLPLSRTRFGRALAARPNDPRVISQINASLAVAISRNWKVGDPGVETELANTLAKVGSEFSRSRSVDGEIRERLSFHYLKAGKLVTAELMKKGAIEQNGPDLKIKSPWRDMAFLKEMLARETNPKTPFEQFVAGGRYTPDELKFEIAMRLLFDGDFAGAQAQYDKKRSQKLSQDPFVLRIRDTFDVDRAKYRGNWTHASVLARLVGLDAKVKAGGEAGAEAAMLVGNAIYNSTTFGISKWMIEGSHAGSAADAELAMRYFKKAHDLSANRELKTKAAFFAAKAEMLMRFDDPPDPDADVSLPLPRTWYPILKSYKGTRYYKEVIKECGRFASWAK